MSNPSVPEPCSRLQLAAQPLLVKTTEAASLLSMSVTAFKSLAVAGRIGPRPIRFGRSVRWSPGELAEWVASGCPPREAWVSREPAGGAVGGRLPENPQFPRRAAG